MTGTGRIVTLLATGVLSACAGRSPEGLGVRSGQLAPCPSSPNCVSSQDPSGGHSIAPLELSGDPGKEWGRLLSLLEQRSDATVKESGPDYLRVEFRTLLGFVDDAEFLLDRTARVIHVRSASRLGYSDFGKNRRRIEELRAALQKAGAARAP